MLPILSETYRSITPECCSLRMVPESSICSRLILAPWLPQRSIHTNRLEPSFFLLDANRLKGCGLLNGSLPGRRDAPWRPVTGLNAHWF